jgi:hypothetical protein
VKLSEFELEVLTTTHLMSSEDSARPVDLGVNRFTLRRKVEYFWLEEEDKDGNAFTEGCFQAGCLLEFPNVASFSIAGPMAVVGINPLNASKIPKIRYAWMKDEKNADWGKMKFELRPLAGADDIVSTAGQGAVLNLQDNDYNPYGIVRAVSYSVDDGEFTPTLKIESYQLKVSGDSKGVLKIHPTRPYEGEAFSQKVTARLTSTPIPPATIGAVEDVPLTVRFTAVYGRPSHICYEAISAIGMMRGSLWKGSAAGPLFEVKHFVLRGRSYGAGDVAYFPTGLVQVCADGSFVFSPNVNSKQEGSIGDIFCYGDVGSPAVLSLQRSVVCAGPYAIRSTRGRKVPFKLTLPEDATVQDYRPISEQKRHVSAGSNLEWDDGFFICDKAGNGSIKAVSETFIPVMLRISQKGVIRPCLVNISICGAEEAVRRYYTHEGQLLEGRPAGTTVTSYLLYAGPEKEDAAQVPVSQTTELDNEAAITVQEDGSFRAWVNSASSTALSVAYRFTREGVSGRGTGVLVGGAGAVAERARSPSTDARPTFAERRPQATEGPQAMQRSSSLSGSTMVAQLRDRSPSIVRRAAQSYPMYPQGTILPAHVVSDAGASNFESVPVGDRVAFILRSKAEVFTSGDCIFRAATFSMPRYCTIAACQGLDAHVPALDGARDLHYEASPDFDLVVSNGVARIRIIKELIAPRTVKVWGVFRKEATEPEFVHSTEIDFVPARIAPLEFRFSPVQGLRVREPLRFGTFNPFEIFADGAFHRKEGCPATVVLSLPGGSCEAEVNFIADEAVDGVTELIPGVSAFVTLDANGARALKILSEADMIFAPAAQGVLALASSATQVACPALSRDQAQVIEEPTLCMKSVGTRAASASGPLVATAILDVEEVSIGSPLVSTAPAPERTPAETMEEKLALLRKRADAVRAGMDKAKTDAAASTVNAPQPSVNSSVQSESRLETAPRSTRPPIIAKPVPSETRAPSPKKVVAKPVETPGVLSRAVPEVSNNMASKVAEIRAAALKKAAEEEALKKAAEDLNQRQGANVTSTGPSASSAPVQTRAVARPTENQTNHGSVASTRTIAVEPKEIANPNIAAMQMMRARLQAQEATVRAQVASAPTTLPSESTSTPVPVAQKPSATRDIGPAAQISATQARVQAIKEQMGVRPATAKVATPAAAVHATPVGARGVSDQAVKEVTAAITEAGRTAAEIVTVIAEAGQVAGEVAQAAAIAVQETVVGEIRLASEEVTRRTAEAAHFLVAATEEIVSSIGTREVPIVPATGAGPQDAPRQEVLRPTGVIRPSRTAVPPVVRVQRSAAPAIPSQAQPERSAATMLPSAHVASVRQATTTRQMVQFSNPMVATVWPATSVPARSVPLAPAPVVLAYLGPISVPDWAARGAARANLPADVRTAGALKKIFNSTPQSRLAAANLAQRTSLTRDFAASQQVHDLFASVPVPCSVFGMDRSERQAQPLQWAGPQGGCIALPGAVVFVQAGTYVVGYTEDGRLQKVTCNVRIHETWSCGPFTTQAFTGPRIAISNEKPVLRAWSMAYNEDAPRACTVSNGTIIHDRTSPCFAIIYKSVPDRLSGDGVWTTYVC